MGLLSKARTAYRMSKGRPKGWQSLLWNTAMAKYRRTGPLMAPVHVAIEPSNACNAQCPVCETGNLTMKRRKGLLDLKAYKSLIDDIAPTTTTLMYYFMGEPFLNKHSYEMIRYARDRGIYVETCTNGDLVDARGVIYSDINKISFQLGGMDEATHRRYRVQSSLAKAHANLHELIDLRRRTPQSNVQIDVGFIVMRHNEHQVDDFLRWAKEIGADTANVIDPCARNMMEAHAYLPKDRKYWFYDEEAFERGVLKPKHLPDNECLWIWNSIQINWDGEAVPCCRDPNGLHPLGNVFEQGLKRVFNGPKARAFRQAVLDKQGSIDICKLCSSYGLPTLENQRPVDFEIKRHSFDPEKLELPPVAEARKSA